VTGVARFQRRIGLDHSRIGRRKPGYVPSVPGLLNVITNGTGAIQNESDFVPFGGERVIMNNVPQNYKFTGKERDAESGNDNFDFRSYDSSLGRFMSPDDDSAQEQSNPQSWNLYSYVLNQPITQTDADGHSVTICSTDEYENKHCRTVSDDAYSAAQQADQNNKAPSLRNLQNADTGMGVITNSSGSPVGTVQWTPDNPGIQSLGLAGAMGMAGLKSSVTQMAFDALAIGFGRLIGGGIEAARAAQLAKAGEEAGVGAEEILARAASSVGNQGIKASSRAVAEEAAEKWVGEGARPIFREGQQIGWESADGTKVVRFTSAGKPDPYINLTNKATGGNLHVYF
jgi:RHS repeat-associated protein